jgi:hypothetical protein
LILGLILIIFSVLLTSINILQRYLKAGKYDPLGLSPTAIKAKGVKMDNVRWIAIPGYFNLIRTPHLTDSRILDVLASKDGHLVGRGKTARGAVKDMVQRHIEVAEEIDLT